MNPSIDFMNIHTSFNYHLIQLMGLNFFSHRKLVYATIRSLNPVPRDLAKFSAKPHLSPLGPWNQCLQEDLTIKESM